MNAELPSASGTRLDNPQTLTVLVGGGEKPFKVLKAILCAHSPFFQVASSDRWLQGKENVVRLPKHDPDLFHVYVDWINTARLDMSFADQHLPPNSAEESSTVPTYYITLARTWVLGNYLGDQLFCNKVIDRILEKVDDLPYNTIGPSSLQQIWDIAPKDSTLLRLCTHLVVARMTPVRLEATFEELPSDIVLEMARRFVQGDGQQADESPTYDHRCDYHVHPEGHPVCGLSL
ncbi:hypothetical protein KC349_g7335 [Hortaea werneckii]|nr:hypothetical protein KC349_g7335 [Hortaea werneckii]